MNPSGTVNHSYAAAGTYTVVITAHDNGNELERIIEPGSQLKEVKQWGTTKWTSMARAFMHATNLKFTATDVPDLSDVTDMSLMFRYATNFNSDISSWD